MERRGTRAGRHDRRVPLSDPVRIFQPLAKALGWTGADQDCGLNAPGLLAKYDRTTRFWRTSERSRSGDSTVFSGPLPKSGTMRNGRIFGPATWRRPTGENGFGLWRTPGASDGGGGSMSVKQARFLARNGMMRTSRQKAQINLRDQVKHPVLFPRQKPPRATSDRGRRQAGCPAARLWPTPTARDYKDGSKSSCANVPVNGLLGRAVHAGSQADGQLSATWTEALMGYPRDWTDLEKEGSFENRYPAAWLNGKWEAGIPRVITGQKNRPRRIKALGNSIVPQIPYLIFLSKEFDQWR